MRVDTPTVLGIVSVSVLCVFAASIAIFDNHYTLTANNLVIKNDFVTLDEINKMAIIHYNNNDEDKVNEQRRLMKENIHNIASDSLGGVNLTKVYLESGYFPFLPASELTQVDPESDKPICDFSSNILTHLQKIPETEMFQLFMEKYSDFPMELHVQDERRHGSDVHYGMYSVSDDGNYSAGMFVHVNSCNDEISSNYHLSCHDKTKDHNDRVIIANTKDRVLASLEHEDFCTVPLDSWHQAVYDYGRVLSDQTRQHFQKVEMMDKDFETVMEFQNELERLSALNDIQNSMYQDESLDVIERNIQEYNLEYGQIPTELQELLDARPPSSPQESTTEEKNDHENDDAKILSEINQQAITYQKNGDSTKFNEHMSLMQQKQKEIATEILEINISNVYIDEGWNFPFKDVSEIELIISNKEELPSICNIPENISAHLEIIKNSEMYSMFSEKYSQNNLEFEISDERNTYSIVHYSIVATSEEDQNQTASVFFHLDSCTGEITVPYNLTCQDKNQEEDNRLQTRFKDEIQSSLENKEFCVIQMEPWHQKMREYHTKVGEQLKQITAGFEPKNNEEFSQKDIFEFHLEFQRLGLLNDMVRSITSGTSEDEKSQELILEYEEKYDGLPDELIQLLEMKEQHYSSFLNK